MKLDKLLKRLKKDAAASPQKAGALALMVVVALYFWAPLVFKGMKGKSKRATSVAASQVILTDDPIIAKAAPHPATNVAHWDRVRTAIANDQFMVAARPDASWQRPFARLHSLKAEQVAKSLPEPTEPATPRPRLPGAEPSFASNENVDIDAAKAALKGVVLSSVLISPRDRAAMIRGNVKRIGDVLELGGDNGAPAVELLICGIDADGVDLDFEGQRLRLERPKPKLSPGDFLRQH